jgi:hypothetical protein
MMSMVVGFGAGVATPVDSAGLDSCDDYEDRFLLAAAHADEDERISRYVSKCRRLFQVYARNAQFTCSRPIGYG